MRSTRYLVVEAHEIERLRRSIACSLPVTLLARLTKEMALSLIEEVLNSRSESDRNREAIEQLRQVLAYLDGT